jgi:hypothetical protein
MNFSDWFIYDETSPTGIRWRVDRWSGEDYRVLNIHAGDPAGTPTRKGYWSVILKRKGYSVHRLIWRMHYGEVPTGMTVDHINRVKSDNRISNLRLVTNEVNKRNSGMYANNSSGVTGVRTITMDCGLYWCAHWADCFTKKKRAAYYSVKKFGFDEAFKMACERRALEIAKLNTQGAQYSETHGM